MMIVVLFVVIAVAGGEPERYQHQVSDAATCFKLAAELSEGLTQEMKDAGVSIGCFQKTAGEPS